jgi:hypothetical protein
MLYIGVKLMSCYVHLRFISIDILWIGMEFYIKLREILSNEFPVGKRWPIIAPNFHVCVRARACR